MISVEREYVSVTVFYFCVIAGRESHIVFRRVSICVILILFTAHVILCFKCSGVLFFFFVFVFYFCLERIEGREEGEEEEKEWGEEEKKGERREVEKWKRKRKFGKIERE